MIYNSLQGNVIVIAWKLVSSGKR